MAETRRWTTHAALVLVQACFAAGAVEGKLAMAPEDAGGGSVSPWALAMARMVAATIFFQGIGLFRARPRPPVAWRDHLKIAGLSLLGIVVNQALFLLGLQITSAFSAALLGACIPIFTAALAVAFRQERASVRTAIGLSLAISGVLWLTGIQSIDRGAIVVALNCLAYSLYLVLGRGIIQRLGAVTVITWLFTWGALLFAPLGAPALLAGAAVWSPRAWWLVGFVIAFPTIIAYLANAWALGRSTASLVTIYIYLQPILTALLNWLQLGESLSERMLVAAAFILLGVAVVTTRRPLRARP